MAIVGHITKDELLRFINGTELANGFFNRFMAIAVQRSKELPFGGQLTGGARQRVHDATLTALRFASLPRRLDFDPEARGRWIEVYGPLSRGEEGLLGAATRRAEAHVVRLAAIYATLDCSTEIGVPHLEAALAVWRYSLDSARWIFGDSLGDPTADEIWTPRQRPPAGRHPHRGSRPFQPEQASPRDRPRPECARRRWTPTARGPSGIGAPDRNLGADDQGRVILVSDGLSRRS